MPLTKQDIAQYLESVDLRTPLESALNAAVQANTTEPDKFFAEHFCKKVLAAGGKLPACCTISSAPPSNFPSGQGASHGPWTDETFAATDADAHVPRYFKEFDEFGEALKAAPGELILRDLLTKEMYDKVGRADSDLPRARPSRRPCPATPPHPRRPPPLHSTRTRRRRSA